MSCCPNFSRTLCGMIIGSAIFAAGGLFFSRAPENSALAHGMPISFPADASAMGKNMSIATGWITDSIEGVFVLDHLTGNLQCWVMNSRSGDIGAVYRTNVTAALGLQTGTEADYVIATGRFDMTNFRKGSLRYANCICYVGESNTGKIVGYSFAYDATTGARGQAQAGEMELVATFPIRDESQIRD